MAAELLDKAIAAHGGLERFQSATEIVVLLSAGGFAFTTRFKSGAFGDVEGRVSTGEARTVLSPYGLRRNIWWDDLDLLYFGGYALWNYVSAPFMFVRPGFGVEEIEPWEENGERWRRLRVIFPAGVATHSRQQDFYFDEKGLLRRLDYTAEPFGNWAKAAHYCHYHREFSGLVMPTRRRVYLRRRNGRPRPRPTLVHIDIVDATLETATGR